VASAVSGFVVEAGVIAPVRIPVVLVVLLLAPGFAVTPILPLPDPMDELCLAVGIAFAVLVLVGTVAVSVGAWAPGVVCAALAVLAAPALVWHGTRELYRGVVGAAHG
jgi:hypothetical protein